MRNEAPVIALAEWAARTNRQTFAAMGVSAVPAECQEARAYLANLMSDQEAAACVAADLARVRSLGERPRDEYAGLSCSFAAACRAADAEFFLQQKDPALMRRWLSQRTAAERKAILQHLEQHKTGGGRNG